MLRPIMVPRLPAEGGHGAEGGSEGALPAGLDVVCPPTDAAAVAEPEAAAPAEGAAPADEHSSDPAVVTTSAGCVPLVDAPPSRLDANGQPVSLIGEDGQALSEAAVLGKPGETAHAVERL